MCERFTVTDGATASKLTTPCQERLTQTVEEYGGPRPNKITDTLIERVGSSAEAAEAPTFLFD